MAELDETTAARRRFWLRRLHSLSGVLPLAVFLLEHLWTNGQALWGARAFDAAVARIFALPALPLIEMLGIFLPLAFHAGYGLVLTRAARPNVIAYPFARNWGYLLQRVTGVLVLVFVLFHLWEFRVQKWLYGMDASAFYPTLAARLSSTTFGVPWRAFAYALGLAATTLHFANGLFGFCCTWGVAVTRRAQARVMALAAVLGGAAFVLGSLVLVHFASGPFWPQDAHETSCRDLPEGGPTAAPPGKRHAR